MILSTEAELIEYGKKLGKIIRQDFLSSKKPVVIELVGDVGVGKTTFTRGIAKGLGIKEPVTSPSFTICKRYVFQLGSGIRNKKESDSNTNSEEKPKSGVLSHYDFYRLFEPGLMLEDLAESITAENSVTVIEWGETVQEILPIERHTYYIYLNDDGTRTITNDTNSTQKEKE